MSGSTPERWNRDRAAAAIDAKLELYNAIGNDGRCPRCEALIDRKPIARDEIAPGLAEALRADEAAEGSSYLEMWIEHADDCPIPDVYLDACRLALRYGIELRPEAVERLVDGKPVRYTVMRRAPD